MTIKQMKKVLHVLTVSKWLIWDSVATTPPPPPATTSREFTHCSTRR